MAIGKFFSINGTKKGILKDAFSFVASCTEKDIKVKTNQQFEI